MSDGLARSALAHRPQAKANPLAPRVIWGTPIVDGAPLAIMENVLPGHVAGITAESLESESLYRLMEVNGLRPAVASQEVSARLATSAEAQQLRDLALRTSTWHAMGGTSR